MKKIILFLLLFSNAFFAQITKLSSLSSSKFLDSQIIYEDNGEDVFGYLILFAKDKINDNETTFEIALLDKNLNKVGITTFTQETFSSWIFKSSWSLYSVKKIKDKIYIPSGQNYSSIDSSIEDLIAEKGTCGLRILDLKTFTISDNYLVKDFGFQKQTEKFDVKHPFKMMKQIKGLNLVKPTKNNGFLISDRDYFNTLMESQSGIVISFSKKSKKEQAFYFYDLELNKKWTYNLNQDEDSKSFFKYNYFDGDGKDLVIIKKYFKNIGDEISDISFDVINSDTGLKKFEIALADNEKTFEFEKFLFEKDKIVLFASVYEFNEKGKCNPKKKQGYVKMSYDRLTGKQIGKDYLYWNSFGKNFDINEDGKIKDYGFIQFLDFKLIDNGKTIVIAEGYKPERFTKILDIFTLVFDDKMKLLEFKKIDKTKNKAPWLDACYGKELENKSSFDYMYSQKLPGNGYVFYYSDNEKEGYSSHKNPKWILGVITYVDGTFGFQKVPLTTERGQIYPIRAKNGYILLKELPNKDSDNDPELRLEKINY